MGIKKLNESYIAQTKYANEIKAPVFAPSSKCWECGKDIWARISKEEASKRLITSCPYCMKSFVN